MSKLEPGGLLITATMYHVTTPFLGNIYAKTHCDALAYLWRGLYFLARQVLSKY